MANLSEKRGSWGTYVAILLQMRRVVQICQQSLAEIMNCQGALLRFCPVRVVAKRVDSHVSETRLGWQPFFWPERRWVRSGAP